MIIYLIEHFEAACQIQEDVYVSPFAYRVHAHKVSPFIVSAGILYLFINYD